MPFMMRGGRIAAVGTTSLRTLESAADEDGTLHAFHAETRLFITPGYRFKAVDVLLTNFHLPRSTLFMLVCAFAGTDVMKRAYAEAIAEDYRFYSYGDACLLFRPAVQRDCAALGRSQPDGDCSYTGFRDGILSRRSQRWAGPRGRMEIIPTILAGGSGTRLWPRSRTAMPKQFLDIATPRSLLVETCRAI